MNSSNAINLINPINSTNPGTIEENKTYVLEIKLEEDKRINVGKLEGVFFKKGYYFYVGSGKKNFKSRIERHLSNNKRKYWHIDYLLFSVTAHITKVYSSEKEIECEIANILHQRNHMEIENFGSTDCKCFSHLFYTDDKNNRIIDLLRENDFKIIRP